eukprot:g3899.t1
MIYDTIIYDKIIYDTIIYDTIIRYDNTIRFDTIRYDMIVWHPTDSIRFDTIRYDTIRYETRRYETRRYETRRCSTDVLCTVLLCTMHLAWSSSGATMGGWFEPQTQDEVIWPGKAGHSKIRNFFKMAMFKGNCIMLGEYIATQIEEMPNSRLSTRHLSYPAATCLQVYVSSGPITAYRVVLMTGKQLHQNDCEFITVSIY